MTELNLFTFQVNVLMSLCLGGGSRLESVGEDDELIVENGDTGSDVAEKPARGGRKHSLPQQLDTVGIRQVAEAFSSFVLNYCLIQTVILGILECLTVYCTWFQFHVL